MYKVIKFFTDLQDNDYPYEVNDIYPREGLEVTGERIEELAGNNNLQKEPLIKKVVETKKPAKKASKKTAE